MIQTPFEVAPTPGAALELAPGVLWMRLPLPMPLDHVNIYALDDGDGWTVVDTGVHTATGRDIWRELLAGPLAGRAVRQIIATHHHPDHIGMAGWLMAGTGADLWTSRTAWLMARMLVLDVQQRPSPEQLNFWRAAGMPDDMLLRRAGERPFNSGDIVHPLPLGYKRLVDGQQLRFGQRHWQVVMGHGHAPCHATFWSLDDDLVIGGDQLLPSISPNLGVYPTEPDADPIAEWLTSCERFAALARPDQLVLPGHKRPYRGLPTRLVQLAENHHRALERLAQALAKTPRTAVGCFDLLFRRAIDDQVFGLAMAEAVAHINHLRHRDVIRPVGKSGHAVLWGR